MMKRLLLIPALTASLGSLHGCMNLSGLDGSSTFACEAPDGVTCMSVTGIYENASRGNLPGLLVTHDRNSDTDVAVAGVGASGRQAVSPSRFKALDSGMPLRVAEKVLRIWVAPFEDIDGDLHDQKMMYVAVRPARWNIESNQEAIRSQFQQTFQLGGASSGNASRDGTEEEKQSPEKAANSLFMNNQNQESSGE